MVHPDAIEFYRLTGFRINSTIIACFSLYELGVPVGRDGTHKGH